MKDTTQFAAITRMKAIFHKMKPAPRGLNGSRRVVQSSSLPSENDHQAPTPEPTNTAVVTNARIVVATVQSPNGPQLTGADPHAEKNSAREVATSGAEVQCSVRLCQNSGEPRLSNDLSSVKRVRSRSRHQRHGRLRISAERCGLALLRQSCLCKKETGLVSGQVMALIRSGTPTIAIARLRL